MAHSSNLLLAASAVLLVTVPAVFPVAREARAVEPARPMALRGVMEKLGRDMQGVTGAISREDWTTVAYLAQGIARHAEPPLAEKMRILAWAGTDSGTFRSFDGQTHEAAVAMGEAAKRGDGQAVIAAFASVQKSCLACHQGFRQQFVEHFYGQR
ncbi:cytochrome c [Thiobacillus sedimenti]|uniref:Cytochrome c n=1 Tax=Thiobacillus sedimenti TaxID=3110231 RepID=A0ABZ1CKS9_9PROT|nr:cytochrome c [Thiobacillus sp. SCUT-2]WRS39680.1 cytochrome c [Thiobacillus sp. SCUT-2]